MSAETVVKKRETGFTAEETERALRMLAECRGNGRMASRRLEELGLPVAFKTLYDWKTRHAERYAHILAEVEDQVHRTIADEYENLALEGIQKQRNVLDKLTDDKLDDLSGKELATVLNSAAMASGIATDKSSALRGRPTAIIENRNPYELLEKWAPVFQQYIEGTAEEIPTEELESGERSEAAVRPAASTETHPQRAPS